MGGRGKPTSKTDIEELEVIDIRGTASGMSWVQQFFKDVTKEPVAKQAAIGGVTGWLVVYLKSFKNI